MAEELKYRQWDLLKPERRKHLMRYPWHTWLNGSIWLLVEGDDFDVPPEEFQAYVLSFARANDLRVKTMVNEQSTGVYIKKLSSNTDRFRRLCKEWEARWEKQKLLGIDEWWKYPERLDDLRARRRAAQEERETRSPACAETSDPYIPGWERKLLSGEDLTGVNDG